MNSERVALMSLLEDPRYKLLQELWRKQVEKVQQGRDKAASQGRKSAWRYWAGQEKGFMLAITSIDRAILEMDSVEDKSETQIEIEKMIYEIRGEPK